MIDVSARTLDEGTVSLLLFRIRKTGSSKLSARYVLAADGPAPDALAQRKAPVIAAGRRLWGLQGFQKRQEVCPQILITGQKAKNFQLFSAVTKEGKQFLHPADTGMLYV